MNGFNPKTPRQLTKRYTYLRQCGRWPPPRKQLSSSLSSLPVIPEFVPSWLPRIVPAVIPEILEFWNQYPQYEAHSPYQFQAPMPYQIQLEPNDFIPFY